MIKVFLLSLLIMNSALATFKAEFPKGPETNLTPGSLCSHPDYYRYEEHIPYCARDVDSELKRDIFTEYRNNGYRLDPDKRRDYKIDHLIPLCAGGSNEEDNLWPQHKSIYVITDPLEGLGCEKLKAGKIKQAELVKLILNAKHNLELVPETLKLLRKL